MKLFFSREVDADQVVIRYTATWNYLLVIGLGLMMLLTFVRFPFNPEPLKQLIFWSYLVFFVVYYVATRRLRREILRAIRERRIKVTGSRFNPRNPLVVTINHVKNPDS